MNTWRIIVTKRLYILRVLPLYTFVRQNEIRRLVLDWKNVYVEMWAQCMFRWRLLTHTSTNTKSAWLSPNGNVSIVGSVAVTNGSSWWAGAAVLLFWCFAGVVFTVALWSVKNSPRMIHSYRPPARRIHKQMQRPRMSQEGRLICSCCYS